MNKKGLKLALTALLAVSQAYALSEMRTPWIASNGPLRYMFEKHDDAGKYDLNLWSGAHTKYANRAFMKHGFKTKEISALIFNQEVFNVGDAAANRASDPTGEHFNPLVDSKTLAPRVEYNEMGMTLGGEISTRINGSKGRIGVRGSVPFRNIEMERLDSGLDKAEDPKADFIKTRYVPVKFNADGSEADNVENTLVSAYRMDMVANLADANGERMLKAADSADGVRFGGSVLGGPGAAGDIATLENLNAAITASRPTRNEPNAFYFQLDNEGTEADGSDVDASYNLHAVTAMAAGGAVPAEDTLQYFGTGVNYGAASGLFSAGSTFEQNKRNLWVVFRRQADSPDTEQFGQGQPNNAGGGGNMAREIDGLVAQYTQNAFGYLMDAGYSLDSQNRSGLGDIDLDVFYDHAINQDWNAELSLGVRLPTGSGKEKYGSPYKVLLGNGEHFELRAGGMLAWQPLSWVNLKADASYSFVLESVEERMAVFAGSTIKNLAPKASADVDWGYLKAHVEGTFFHPKTRDLRSVFGYELYYKTKDNVNYKSATALAFDGSSQALDGKLAAANTESVAHKVRFETSYQLGEYVEIFCGGSWTFAGQYVMRDRDTFGGFNVRF